MTICIGNILKYNDQKSVTYKTYQLEIAVVQSQVWRFDDYNPSAE